MALPPSAVGEPTARLITGACTLAPLLIVRAMAALFEYGSGAMQFEVDVRWIPTIGARYHMGVDGISLALFVLTYVVTFLCFLYSLRWVPEPTNLRAFF